MRVIHVIVTALAAGSLLLAPAIAQQRGPEDPTIAEVETSRARPGDTVAITGTGWEPGSQIEISLRERRVGFATAEADGTWEAGVEVPDLEPPQTIRFVVSGTSMTGEETTVAVRVNVVEGTPRGTVVMVVLAAVVVLLVLLAAWALFFRPRRPPPAQRGVEEEAPAPAPDRREEPYPNYDRR